eukprot:Sspe_Gene.47110::Locus_23787_Transcript_1_1_Confidence_1.000_Length_1173::g.47110::m.47110
MSIPFMTGCGFVAVFSSILLLLNPTGIDPYVVLQRIAATLVVLITAHLLVLRHTTAPYYIAHIIVNGVICSLAMKDLIFVATDTEMALRSREYSTWAMDVCNALHFYHVFCFTDLRFVDYLHHVIMNFFCMPLFYAADYGPLANYNMFFVSGLPGGIDYVLLYMVRLKKLRKIEEKKWNTSINVWIRGPFLLGSVFFSHVQSMLLWNDLTTTQIIYRYVCQVVQFWNAMYFTESVVGDYYRLSLQRGKIALYHDLSDDDSDDNKDGPKQAGGVMVTERGYNTLMGNSPTERQPSTEKAKKKKTN